MNTPVTPDDIRQRMISFVAGAQQMLDDYNTVQGYHWRDKLLIDSGKKYARIVKTDEKGENRSAWAFIDLTNGDILKPASWKTPAKHARGSILEPDFGVSKITPYGPAYLRG